jgi:magnesium transporter
LITIYRKDLRPLNLNILDQPSPDLSDAIWIDILNPSAEEHAAAEALFGMALPNSVTLKDIEPSSRLHTEASGLYLTIWLVSETESHKAKLVEVGFVLTPRHLISLRYKETRAFASVAREYGAIEPQSRTPIFTLLTAIDTISDASAEVLERAVEDIDKTAGEVFGRHLRGKRKPSQYLEERVASFVAYHRLLSKVRDSLISTTRLMSYLHTKKLINDGTDYADFAATISHDMQTLAEHANFISGNLSFLLDATLGIISVEQNAIIKIFSIASVVFLPPTLVASIYGMNFHIMPELHWTYGYPLAIFAMVITAVIPFVFFRWKGWL